MRQPSRKRKRQGRHETGSRQLVWLQSSSVAGVEEGMSRQQQAGWAGWWCDLESSSVQWKSKQAAGEEGRQAGSLPPGGSSFRQANMRHAGRLSRAVAPVTWKLPPHLPHGGMAAHGLLSLNICGMKAPQKRPKGWAEEWQLGRQWHGMACGSRGRQRRHEQASSSMAADSMACS